MATVQVILLVLLVASSSSAGTANGLQYQYYAEVDTPAGDGSELDVMLGFRNRSFPGWTRTVPSFALPGTNRPFHTTDQLLDPCRLTVQLKPAGLASDLSAKWVPTRIEIVAYEYDGVAPIYHRKYVEFSKFFPVTANHTFEIHKC